MTQWNLEQAVNEYLCRYSKGARMRTSWVVLILLACFISSSAFAEQLVVLLLQDPSRFLQREKARAREAAATLLSLCPDSQLAVVAHESERTAVTLLQDFSDDDSAIATALDRAFDRRVDKPASSKFLPLERWQYVHRTDEALRRIAQDLKSVADSKSVVLIGRGLGFRRRMHSVGTRPATSEELGFGSLAPLNDERLGGGILDRDFLAIRDTLRSSSASFHFVITRGPEGYFADNARELARATGGTFTSLERPLERAICTSSR